MSCCGQARSGAGISVTGGAPSTEPGLAVFEYVGRTALSVNGGSTGVLYRFAEPGARVTVDWRDQRSLDALPMLKQVG